MAETILITGGSGFVGRAVVKAVREKHPDWIVHVFDLHEPKEKYTGVSYVAGDITNALEVDDVVIRTKPTAIIHTAGIVPSLASRYRRKERNQLFRVNVEGTRNILVTAKRENVIAFVWTSSFTAVTDDFRFQYPNIDDSWTTSSHSLIYGESKASSAHEDVETDL